MQIFIALKQKRSIVIIEEEGYDFRFDPSKCESCGGYCCRGESGYIWVKYEEIEKISKKLSMSVEDFAIIYLKKVGHRYSLIEKKVEDDDYACIFFDLSTNRCSIYEERPNQCRTFPFWQQFKNDKDEVKNQCPGVV
ncbi:MAG: YkgJ family cysteine cluster protein [Campylobacterales bacterium]|nr:YkgJ family cysteine cluster protein [Campylobacterales bacterium]